MNSQGTIEIQTEDAGHFSIETHEDGAIQTPKKGDSI